MELSSVSIYYWLGNQMREFGILGQIEVLKAMISTVSNGFKLIQFGAVVVPVFVCLFRDRAHKCLTSSFSRVVFFTYLCLSLGYQKYFIPCVQPTYLLERPPQARFLRSAPIGRSWLCEICMSALLIRFKHTIWQV